MAVKAFRFVENRLLELPDLPPMYDCESNGFWRFLHLWQMLIPLCRRIQSVLTSISRADANDYSNQLHSRAPA